MIEPAMFAVIRDGETTLYRDPSGSAMVARNLVWGPETLETWLLQRQPADHFDEDADAGAVIDFDAQALLWYGDLDLIEHVRGHDLLDVLIETAWSGFEVLYATDGLLDLRIAAGDESLRRNPGLIVQDGEEDDCGDDAFEDRFQTIQDDLLESEDLGELEEVDSDTRFSWIVILDHQGAVHHRRLTRLTMDVIQNEGDPINELLGVPSCDVPAEANLVEGIIVDQNTRSISLWGGRSMPNVECLMRLHWPGWKIIVIPRGGYQQQCQASGPPGQPLDDAEALGDVIPQLLFTKRVDPALILGTVGDSVKGCLKQVVGGLTFLVCLPFAIFALFTGNGKVGGLIIGLIVFTVVIVFKWFEFRWKRNFRLSLQAAAEANGEDSVGHAIVAGPLDDQARRGGLDALLKKSQLPGLAQIEPHFVDVV